MSTDWLDLFPNCVQVALSRPTSNQCPISLDFVLDDWGPPPFRLEMMWLQETSFIDSVKEWWEEFFVEGWMGFQLSQKLKLLKKKINSWKKDHFGKVEEHKVQILANIHQIDLKEENGLLDDQDRSRQSFLQEEFYKKALQEEIKWKQRSKNKWLDEGDRNTKYFHGATSARRHTNWITSIFSQDHLWENKQDIENEIVLFFKNLYKRENINRPKLSGILFE